jgi:outer membrane protein TolC
MKMHAAYPPPTKPKSQFRNATSPLEKKTARPCGLLLLTMSALLIATAPAFAAGKKSRRAQPETRSVQALSLSDFLKQVEDQHDGLKAANDTALAAKLYSAEGSLLFKPNLTGTGTYSSQGISNPFDAKDRLHAATYNVGISEQTDFGMVGKFTYNRSEFDVPQVTPFNSSWFQVEASQSLWRNWAGRESRAQARLIEAGALAKSFSQSFLARQYILGAESAYWRLVLAREVVVMQQDAVERAQKINDWTNHRVQMQLVDRSETLQGSTNLQARVLDLRTAQDDERAAELAFNTARGADSVTVPEHLTTLTPELISQLGAPARTLTRDDIKAAQLQAETNQANAELSAEKDKPTVEIFAVLPVTEPSQTPSAALAQSIPQSAVPATTVGLRLTVPLDWGTLDKAKQGWRSEAEAAKLTYKRKLFEETRDWDDLKTKFEEAKDRLKLYVDLEHMQREKLYYERERQTRGRSTLQQVLIYESDYELAVLGRIRTLADIITLNAQMKQYGASNESR